jgi:hypothetical protein
MYIVTAAVLCCIVMCCAVLCCAVLCCAVSTNADVLCNTVLHQKQCKYESNTEQLFFHQVQGHSAGDSDPSETR